MMWAAHCGQALQGTRVLPAYSAALFAVSYLLHLQDAVLAEGEIKPKDKLIVVDTTAEVRGACVQIGCGVARPVTL